MRTTLNQYAICRAMLCTGALAFPSLVSAQEVLLTVGKGTLNRQIDGQTVRQVAVEPYHFTAALYGASPVTAPNVFVRIPQGTRVSIPYDDDARYPFYLLDRSFASRSALDTTFPNGGYTVQAYATDLRLADNAYPNTPYIVNWDWAQDIDTTLDFPLKWIPFSNHNPNDLIFLEPFVSPPFPNPLIDPAATSITIPAYLLRPNETVSCRLLFFRATSFDNPDQNEGIAGYGGYYRETRFTIRGGAPPPPQGRIQFSDDAYVVSENEGPVHITVTRTGGTEGTATVIVNTVDDSASLGRDHSGFPQTVFFDEGVFVQQVSIPILDDRSLRGDRQFYVVLSDVTGGAEIRQPNTAVVTIKEDESAAVGEAYFSADRYSVSETDEFARLKVLRSGDFTRAMTVQYATVVHQRRVPPDEARPGKDFAPTYSAVRFEEGQGEVEIRIPIIDDTDFELSEHFQVRLSNPSAGGSLGYSRYLASVYIRSDDLPNLTGERNVSGQVKVTGCGLRGGRANGVIQFQSQEGSQFVATASLVLPHGRITQTFRGQVTADGQLSGSYSWRGNGDRGAGSFTGRTETYYAPNPFIILSFRGRSRIYGCRQAGDLHFGIPPGSVASQISSP